MLRLKNFTGHTIIVGGQTLQSDGNIRLSQSTEKIWEYNGIEIIKSTFGNVTLPDVQEDIGYIVSHIICQKFPKRNDLYIVGGKQKDSTGQIIGAQHLIINPYYNDDER